MRSKVTNDWKTLLFFLRFYSAFLGPGPPGMETDMIILEKLSSISSKFSYGLRARDRSCIIMCWSCTNTASTMGPL